MPGFSAASASGGGVGAPRGGGVDYRRVASEALSRCIPGKMARFVRVIYGERPVTTAGGESWLDAEVKSALGSLRCRVRVGGGPVVVEMRPSS